MILQTENGIETVVDEEEFLKLPPQKWIARRAEDGRIYIYGKYGALHRQLMRMIKGDGLHVDHIRPNSTLDNRMNNLRVATAAQNNANRGKNKNNTTGFKGVTWSPRRKKYQAQIFVNRKCLFLGRFETPQAAHQKYSEAAVKYFGEFARTI